MHDTIGGKSGNVMNALKIYKDSLALVNRTFESSLESMFSNIVFIDLYSFHEK